MHDEVPRSRRISLLAASSLTVMAGAIVAPGVPLTSQVFEVQHPGDGELLAKLVLSLPALAIALFAPISGIFVDRFGSRRLLLGGLVLYALAGTTGIYLEDAYWVLGGRLALGMAVAMVMTTATTLISQYFHGAERGRFLGLQATFMALGGVVLLPLGGVLAYFGGHHLPYIVYFASVPIAIACWKYLPEPPRRNDPNLPPPPVTGDYPALVHLPTILLVYGIAFVGMAAFYLGPPQLPFLMKSKFGLGPLVAAPAVATITLGAAISSMLFGRLIRRFDTTRMIAGFFLLLGIGFTIVGLAERVEVCWLGLPIAGLGGGLYTPTLSNWLMRIAPPALRGRLAGGMISAMFAGQFLSPILAQPLIAEGGVSGAFQWAGLGLVVLGTAYLFGTSSGRRRRRAAAPHVAVATVRT